MSIDYQWLYDTVRARFDSDKALDAFLPQPLSSEELRQKDNGYFLSAMTQRVFQAGMQHSMVNAKWPAFEEVFAGFDPQHMAALGEADLQQFMQDKRIIRHLVKLQSIPENARFILEICAEQGSSFGEWLARWPGSDIIGLWRLLGKRAARLGGRSAAGFLRLAGKDSFLLTSHVVARLVDSGVIAGEPRRQQDLQTVQNTFNAMHLESGRPLCQLSAMMALSIHPAF